ncbi:MAG: hypothetical protein CMJ89_17900 [Planctomycetes bacterium]|jgi:hypothetical protein|nr:hypothetical protein [Planctomycetota bacterium]
MSKSPLLLAALVVSTPCLAQKTARPPAPTLGGCAANGVGVLTEAPAEGLYTLDGPEAFLAGDFEEWYGLQYFVDGVLYHVAGCGNGADWAQRPPVEPVSFSTGAGSCVSIVRDGALRIETTLEYDPTGPHILGRVRFYNEGDRVISGLMYSREWRQPGTSGWNFPPDFVPAIARPPEICRLVWMMDDLPPGLDAGLRFSYRIGEDEPFTGPADVPLALFINDIWINGVNLGDTNGVSFGDFDADGYIDIFALESGRLLRNEEGTNWRLAVDIDDIINNSGLHYGSSFGDYNNDGLPDIGTEPRTGCTHLLKNLGEGNFVDIAEDPALFEIQPCSVPAETICWGDVDDDGDLDMFLPVYPGSAGGPGNFFWENLGPVGPGGEYALIETSAEAGVNNPPMTARPEGAQFVDLDSDGDIDLYSNGTLYQNNSLSEPDFDAMITAGSGIGARRRLDEGAAFFDYDLDGDYDLFIVYNDLGVRIWENFGDGHFFGEQDIIDNPMTGLTLGLSAADWDNDGDIDFTTRQIFRKNLLMETGERHFTNATHMIPIGHRRNATPSWGDWDLDGDLDCALGNWMSKGKFYDNVLYTAETPASQKPFVRVRAVRDSEDVPAGLETEYGASVEIVLRGEPKGKRFRQFVSSAGGYLNQNEYTLHFAIPPGPDPTNPVAGRIFDVVVDFPGRPDRGLLRIDKHVNPALGDIRLATLQNREIKVFRSGKVVREGVEHAPAQIGFSARLRTTTNGLILPTQTVAPPDPIPSTSSDHWVGIEFDTLAATRSVLVKELLLDGQADGFASCSGTSANFVVWDVTDGENPKIVFHAGLKTSPRNQRSSYLQTFKLAKGRIYRAVARVTELRATEIAGPVFSAPIDVRGGLSFRDPFPCDGAAVVDASVDPTRVYLALRFTQPYPLHRTR